MKEYFQKESIECSALEEGLFQRFLAAFMAYNTHTNLSAIRDEEWVIVKHFVDSAELLKFVKLRGRILDIGTGGGFPGIPLKIFTPELDVTLLDSVGKKIRACESFIQDLGLEGIRAVNGRAEDVIKQEGYRKGFDFVVSRATAYLPSILLWAEPFLKEKWVLVLYKSPSDEEIADGEPMLRKLHLKLDTVHTYTLGDQERKLFVYRRDRT